jgi:hypothetical protein
MRQSLLALVLLFVVSGIAFGQVAVKEPATVEVDCDDPCVVAPFFMGSGGFVVERMNEDDDSTPDIDEGLITFVLACDGGRFLSASATPDENGIVRQTLSEDTGYVCGEDELGEVHISNAQNGGWYWINDDVNSAVSLLIDRDALERAETIPLDAGGVTIMKRDKARYIKHEPTGRVAILPHVQPIGAGPPGCAGDLAEAGDCRIGSADDWRIVAIRLVVTSSGLFPRQLRDGETITRGRSFEEGGFPGLIYLYLVGSNYLTVGDAVTATAGLTGGEGPGDIVFASPGGVTLFPTGGGAVAERVLLDLTFGFLPPLSDLVRDGTGSVGGWGIRISDEATGRCASGDRWTKQKVVFDVSSALGGAVPAFGEGKGPKVSFYVRCPALPEAAASGVELVPDNPFAVD